MYGVEDPAGHIWDPIPGEVLWPPPGGNLVIDVPENIEWQGPVQPPVTTPAPTYSVTTWAPKLEEVPWWVWLLAGLVAYQAFDKRKR